MEKQFLVDDFKMGESWRIFKIIGEFVDDLSTWYLRRSRDRFKGEDESDKKQAASRSFEHRVIVRKTQFKLSMENSKSYNESFRSISPQLISSITDFIDS